DEFRERETNEALLSSLAHVAPKNAAAGKLIDAPTTMTPAERLARLLETNAFRHDLAPATSSQAVWHLLALVAGCLFFFDVFVRRVTGNFEWVGPLAANLRSRILGRPIAPDVVATMERLRERKAEVSEGLEQKKAALRFEPADDAKADVESLREAIDQPQ